MTLTNRAAAFTAVITALWLIIATPVLADETSRQNFTIDLASVQDNSELTSLMLSISNNSGIEQVSDAVNSSHWQRITEHTLRAPRQHSTTWLKSTLYNSSDQPLIRWLVLEPWRLNRVEAFFISPDTGKVVRKNTTGLDIPLKNRTINNGKTLIPVHLNAGETQQLILKIYSDSLPFLSIQSWEPVSYSQTINDNRIFQVALFSGIVVLLVVLMLQFNASLMITGIWLLVAFIFETEKNGFFSNYLLSFLEDYSANLRVSGWVFTEQLFLTTSVFLLGLNHHPRWRTFLMITATAAVVIVGLSFVLDGASIRNLGVLLTSLYAISWLFMILPALRLQHNQQLTIIFLLAIYWLVSSFLLLGYTFNFYYTSAFVVARIYVEIFVVLALILAYSWQQKRQLAIAENALKSHELHSRKKLEKAVKDRTEELNQALETARKASNAKVNFLGQVTHDLRAPLTAILGYAQLHLGGVVNAQKANQVIQDSAHYMKDLVEGLVNYAKDTSADHNTQRDIYLIAFLDNLVNQFHVLANQQGNRFQLKIESELPTVIHCNSTQLQRILLNLLDNAAKYTHQGEISLSIAAGSHHHQKTALIFRVSDTGRGITPEQLEHIYTPFYQSADNNPGHGLGLPICFELAERLGGSLELTSKLGKGTLATCTIPYLAGDEQLVTPSLPAIQDLLPTFNALGQTAWVIEDSLQISELLDDELTYMGFNTRLFSNAEDFISAIKTSDEAPTIIITDYQLPGVSGLEVLRCARATYPRVPVVLLSATHSSHPPLLASPELRFCASLTKPVDLLTLRLTLAKLCHLS